jgi:PAS domain S-box-containing protein
MVWRSNTAGHCDYFNLTWLSFTGRTLEEEIGEGWLVGVHPDDREPCITSYLDHFARREPFEMEYRLRRHDGFYRYIFDRGVPFEDEAGRFAGFIGSCVDVHERRELDAQKARFLAMVAHELRTPLQSLGLFLEGLRRKAALREPIPEGIFQRLGRQVDRLGSLVRDVGEVAHMEHEGKLPIRREELDLADLVRDVAGFHEEALRMSRKNHHVLALRVPEGSFAMQGDRDRLAQVLTNLFDNAIKYSPQGGTIEITLARDGAHHRVSVKDPGIGIPSAEVPLVTRRYFRASNASELRFQGIGVGLSLSREIVERHGGRLTIESGLGQGTTVTFTVGVRGEAA